MLERFQTDHPEVAAQVLAAMAPRIEAEIQRIVAIGEAARVAAIAEAIGALRNDQSPERLKAHFPQPLPMGMQPRRSAWTDLSPEQRSAEMRKRWQVRRAKRAAGAATKPRLASSPGKSVPEAPARKSLRLVGDTSPFPGTKAGPGVDLRNGDCLTELMTLPPASVDLLVGDLPYGLTACEWDQQIDLSLLWDELRRVMKPSGVVTLMSSGRFTGELMTSNPDWFKYALVWVKTRKTLHVHAKHRPLGGHEDVLVFAPGGASWSALNRATYNPQGLSAMERPREYRQRDATSPLYKGGLERARGFTQTVTNYPDTVLTFASEGKRLHPTQKPLALMEHLIATYSDPGALVVDPTMGSGTTGVAAKNLGRSFLGIEKDETFFRSAAERIGPTDQEVAA